MKKNQESKITVPCSETFFASKSNMNPRFCEAMILYQYPLRVMAEVSRIIVHYTEKCTYLMIQQIQTSKE
jgi:hypothetical protein